MKHTNTGLTEPIRTSWNAWRRATAFPSFLRWWVVNSWEESVGKKITLSSPTKANHFTVYISSTHLWPASQGTDLSTGTMNSSIFIRGPLWQNDKQLLQPNLNPEKASFSPVLCTMEENKKCTILERWVDFGMKAACPKDDAELSKTCKFIYLAPFIQSNPKCFTGHQRKTKHSHKNIG